MWHEYKEEIGEIFSVLKSCVFDLNADTEPFLPHFFVRYTKKDYLCSLI